MDKDVLEGLLAVGLSLEAIGRRVERHPSTVSYWLKKHGLQAVGRTVYAARGGIERDALAALVDERLSSREIAERLGVSQSTVRHWLTRHGLRTAGSGKATRPRRTDREVFGDTCEIHGATDFVVRGDGFSVCRQCRSDAVVRRRRRVKRQLVREAGGGCVMCGYDACMAALQFHHVDPATKVFQVGGRGIGRAGDLLRAEAAKCVLLCANCHAEVESGYTDLPATMTRPLPDASGVAHDPG